jgi:hypothetical protein
MTKPKGRPKSPNPLRPFDPVPPELMQGAKDLFTDREETVEITNGTIEQSVANSLTNPALAQRLSMIEANRRAFTKKETDAFLAEAATRLLWADNYAKHTEHA